MIATSPMDAVLFIGALIFMFALGTLFGYLYGYDFGKEQGIKNEKEKTLGILKKHSYFPADKSYYKLCFPTYAVEDIAAECGVTITDGIWEE